MKAVGYIRVSTEDQAREGDKLRCLTILLLTLLIDGGGCDWLPMEANRNAVHTFAMDIEDTVDSLLKEG